MAHSAIKNIESQSSSSDDDSNEDTNGFKRTSLIKLLKSVLDQYPDDGEILKELIQNAEDARATKVKFLFDESSYPTSSLSDPEFAKFQGPALFAYNDAVFSKMDWKGIRLIHDSIKRKNPMKCGRFGLGFKSVLRMTDLPSVLSDDRLCFFDPNEKLGGMFSLKQMYKDLQSKKKCDQFKPYTNMVKREVLEQGHYSKTLFRFPLRTRASRLSDTVYDSTRMMHVLESFQLEAHLILLFLKHIQCISIYHKHEKSESANLLFEVRVTEDCLAEVQKKRREFFERCHSVQQQHTDASVKYVVNIVTTKYKGNMDAIVKHYSWLVTEYRAGKHRSVHLERVSEKLASVALVGIAAELPSCFSQSTPTSSSAVAPALGSSGSSDKVFCHLPLSGEHTGLPVIVNGCFAINQNRSYLKWPTVDYQPGNDDHLDWNACLLNEVLPLAYLDLIDSLIKQDIGNCEMDCSELLYKVLPNLSQTNQKWLSFVEKLYKSLSDKKFLYTEARGGRWLSVEEAVFFSPGEEDDVTHKLIKDVLLQCEVNIVSISGHVLSALCHYHNDVIKLVTPTVVQEAMKRNHDSYKSRTWEEKLTLLAYILKENDYMAVLGLELLPCADGIMATFDTDNSAVYVATPDTPVDLFPGLKHKLVASDLSPDLLEHIISIAEKGVSQVKLLDQDSVERLLHAVVKLYAPVKSLTPLTLQLPSFAVGWFARLWKYLEKMYPSSLEVFSGLHILPLSSSEPITVLPLHEAFPCTVSCHKSGRLSEVMIGILKLFGAHVVHGLPSYVEAHPAVYGKYIKRPTASGLLKVLHQAYLEKKDRQEFCRELSGKLSEDERVAIIAVLASIAPTSVTDDIKSFLRQLPIFTAYHLNGEVFETCVSVAQVSEAVPIADLPCAVSHKLINPASKDTRRALELLGATILTPSDVIKTYALDDLSQGFLSEQNIEVLITYISNHISDYKNNTEFIRRLSQSQFVMSGGNDDHRAFTPGSLFDPEDHLVKQLFIDQDEVFPSAFYCKSDILSLLRTLGLKTTSTVKDSDIARVLKCIDKSFCQKTIGKALLDIFNLRPELLNSSSHAGLIECAKNYKWVPVCDERCPHYPVQLPWQGEMSGKVACPSDVKAKEFSGLIGSVSLLVDIPKSSRVAAVFNWNKDPTEEDVLRHFRCIIESMRPENRVECLPIIQEIYRFLACRPIYLVKEAIARTRMDQWIWHGSGFARVDSVFPKINLLNGNLSPFVYTLPEEMKEFIPFLVKMGMKEQCSCDRLVEVLQQIGELQKQRKDDGAQSEKFLSLSVVILDYLKDHLENVSSVCRDEILVPVVCQDDAHFLMCPVKKSTFYYKNETARDLSVVDVDENQELLLVHPRISASTAEALGVPTLMSRILDAEELMITDFGQSESLVERIRNLLVDYSDGMAIFKEMIQNADDAGATEVMFMYDERSNDEHCTALIDAGMEGCQGPALWVYNNSVFTDKDFSNIRKLGGATKAEDTNTIGSFGLGFNVVYNLTDVPSFISRKYMVIFDPLTKHLSHTLRDKRQPGIKLDLSRKTRFLRKIADQLYPFINVFGFQFPEDDQWSYDGTLLRLPLRTQWQVDEAGREGISPKHYTRREMQSLLQLLKEHLHDVLLFTRNVNRVSVLHLASNDLPENAEVVLSLQKNTLREAHGEVSNCTFLKLVRNYMESPDGSPPQTSGVIKTTVECFDNALELHSEDGTSVHHWLVAWSGGRVKSVAEAKRLQKGLLPVAAVTISLSKSGDSFTPQALSEFDTSLCQRNVFCFLPLPIASGLEVIINGSFAIEANRKHLSVYSGEERDNTRARWNELLMEDAGWLAYKTALTELCRQCSPEEDVDFLRVWPKCTESMPFSALSTAFFRNWAEVKDLPFVSRRGEVFSLEKTAFFDFASVDESTGISISAVFVTCMPDCAVVSPPWDILKALNSVGNHDIVKRMIYDKYRFYAEVFFPNISDITSDVRNSLVAFALMSSDCKLDDLLKKNRCIPVTPNGRKLENISRLFHPHGKVATGRLYSDADGRFPFGNFAHSDLLRHLVRLGMSIDEVSWDDLRERCSSLPQIMDRSESDGNTVLSQVFHFMERNIMFRSECNADRQKTMQSIPFLKYLRKPANFPLPWKGETLLENRLFSAHDLYEQKYSHLVSVTKLLADEAQIPDRVKHYLGLYNKKVEMTDLYTQLKKALEVHIDQLADFSVFERVMFDIYKYLNDNHKSMTEDIIDLFEKVPSVLCGKTFVLPRYIAYNISEDISPYLWKISEFSRIGRLRHLLERVGVREDFQVQDFMEAMSRIRRCYKDKSLVEHDLSCYIKLLTMLNQYMKRNNVDINAMIQSHGKIYIPDSRAVLRPADSLCYNECTWMSDPEMLLTHERIPQALCYSLGVETMRRKILGAHLGAIPFGQKERLTTSLSRICESYPRERVLKELIQNADDAGARTIHFILDKRQHGRERVFDDRWKSLQGPALCVYNNGAFTFDDLEGIQRLGEGSKRDDPYRTGQYGVGFSSVYHLTDVPSLLTYTDRTKKTLCVFDPHCAYTSMASAGRPGARFDNVESLEEKFSDVFSCYKFDGLDVSSGGCIFRLPLRSNEQQSEIVQKSVTEKDIYHLFETLFSESCEILLFLKSLKEIIMSEVQADGTHIELHVTSLCLDEKQEADKSSFMEKMKQFSRDVRCQENFPRSQFATLYPVEIQCDKERTNWCVSQVLGFSPNTAPVLPRVSSLVPVGGCAVPLYQCNSKKSEKKAFCFLPLPEETGLPVHVNGHFSLGLESRGYVWSDDKDKEEKFAWNKLLCSGPIAEAYVALLEYIKGAVDVKISVSDYLNMFPSLQKESRSNWNILVEGVYSAIVQKSAQLFPFISEASVSQITWFPAVTNRVLFSRKNTDCYKKVLLRWNIPVVESTEAICNGLDAAKANISYLTAANVVNVLRRCSVNTNIGPLKETPFGSRKTLLEVFSYCLDGVKTVKELDRLPMLLTLDNQVKVFNLKNPLFDSSDANLFPHSKSVFVDPKILKRLSTKFKSAVQMFVRCIEIGDVHELLMAELPSEFHSSDSLEDVKPSYLKWIQSFWLFLTSKIGCNGQRITQNLGKWCLLPVEINKTKLLYPIRRSTEVVYVEESITDRNEKDIGEFLRNSDVPRLNFRFFTSPLLVKTDPYRHLFANFLPTTRDPNAIVRILSKTTQMSKLPTSTLLQYLRTHISKDHMEPASIGLIRRFPIFKDMRGNLVSLDDKPVYTLPDPIPHAGMDIFHNQTLVIFLKADNDFQELYDSLGCKRLETVDFYTDFVFKQIELLDDEMIAIHMYFLYDAFLRERDWHVWAHNNAVSLRERLLEALKKLPFLETASGIRQPAYHLYSRRNEVFVAMCPDNLAPEMPKCWLGRQDEWFNFLQKVGVVEDVNEDLFVILVRQLASEYRGLKGNMRRSEPAVRALVDKSRIMVRCLSKIQTGNITSFLKEVSRITFIAQHKCDQLLTDLCPQYNSETFVAFAGSASCQHEQLIWTKVNLLPQWANPKLPGQNQMTIAQHLQVIVDPPVEMVAENLINVVNHVNREQVTLALTEKTVEVFRCMYRYLQEQDVLPADVIKKLSDEPIVLIVREGKFIVPSKTVEALSENAELRPYLYRIPPEFGIFAPLLKRLGATEQPTAEQYMAVLTDIKREVGEEILTSESLLVVKKAFVGLFTELKAIDRESFVTEVLYLPNEDNRLVNARHLTFNDAPAFYLRMAELMFVCDVHDFGFDVSSIKRCLKRLPERLQPRYLSECITEELVGVDAAPPEVSDDAVADLLNERIRSEEFGRMVLRLLHHEATCSQERIDKESLSSLAERLSVVRVIGVDQVRTQLRYKQVIPGSIKEKVCFLSKARGQLADVCQWLIYIKKGCPLQVELLVPLADVIDTILDGKLRKSALYLLPLLNGSDTSMSRTLDEYNIT